MAAAISTPTGNIVKFPLVTVEDALINISTLVRFGLFAIENGEDNAMSEMRSEFTTLLYLIRDQVQQGETGLSSHARRRSERKS